MDPNENLREQRAILSAVGRRTHDDWCRLAELVEALDEWITKGGFLPTAWQQKKDSASDVCKCGHKRIRHMHGRAKCSACVTDQRKLHCMNFRESK